METRGRLGTGVGARLVLSLLPQLLAAPPSHPAVQLARCQRKSTVISGVFWDPPSPTSPPALSSGRTGPEAPRASPPLSCAQRGAHSSLALRPLEAAPPSRAPVYALLPHTPSCSHGVTTSSKETPQLRSSGSPRSSPGPWGFNANPTLGSACLRDRDSEAVSEQWTWGQGLRQ